MSASIGISTRFARSIPRRTPAATITTVAAMVTSCQTIGSTGSAMKRAKKTS
jgi:hypothetical protein